MSTLHRRTFLSLLSAVLGSLALAVGAAEPAPKPAGPGAADPAMIAWREQVLPGIRTFLEAENTALAAMGEECRRETDPARVRLLQERIELRKLGTQRHLLAVQLDWAQTFARLDLGERLTEALRKLDSAHPELSGSAVLDAPAAPGASQP